MLSWLMTTKEQFVLLLLAGAIGLGALVLYAARHPETQNEGIPVVVPAVEESIPFQAQRMKAELSELPATPMEPKKIRVSVVGAVKKPALYTMKLGDRIQDLIDTAGGTKQGAVLLDVNLAAHLIDGTTLIVPPLEGQPESPWYAPVNPPQYTLSGGQLTSGPALPFAADYAAQSSGGQIINLNSASQAELETLPGIGPKLAREIITYRTMSHFQVVDELLNVSGIGPKRMETVRPLVTVF